MYRNRNITQDDTKHYYTGAERVVSKIGGGGLRDITYPVGPYLTSSSTGTGSASQAGQGGCMNKWLDWQEPYNKLWEQCIDGLPPVMHEEAELELLYSYQSIQSEEPLIYFYHPDHLGSAAWVTDSGGHAIQHLQYLPFGETLLDQRTTSWNTRYSFSAKEKDEESGYHYFGARYYDSELSIWLSVDPQAAKYWWITPYAYALNNPIKLIDPNGEEIEIALEIRKTKDEPVGETVIYKGGTLYNHDGSEYTGNSSYARGVQKDLNDLKGTAPSLNNMISDLEEPGKIHTISMIASPDENTTYANGYTPNSRENAANGKGTGSSITYNPWNKRDGEHSTSKERINRPAKIGLAHELGHAYFGHKGKADYNKTSRGVSFFEVQAVNVENIARSVYGHRERTTYGGVSIREHLQKRQ